MFNNPADVGPVWQQRNLIRQLLRREITGRYKGSFLGVFWTLLQPLLMLAVYTLVFGMVFEPRWQGASGSKLELAAILFSGLLVFNLFAECINRSPQLMLENTNYVKRVVFPLNILPIVVMGQALFHAAMSVAVLAVFFQRTPAWDRDPGVRTAVPEPDLLSRVRAAGFDTALDIHQSHGVYYRAGESRAYLGEYAGVGWIGRVYRHQCSRRLAWFQCV